MEENGNVEDSSGKTVVRLLFLEGEKKHENGQPSIMSGRTLGKN